MVAMLTTVESVAYDHGGGFIVLHHRRRSIPRAHLLSICLTQDGSETNKGGEVNNDSDGEDDYNK